MTIICSASTTSIPALEPELSRSLFQPNPEPVGLSTFSPFGTAIYEACTTMGAEDIRVVGRLHSFSTQTRTKHTWNGPTARIFRSLMFCDVNLGLAWILQKFNEDEISGDDASRWLHPYLNERNTSSILAIKEVYHLIGSPLALAKEALRRQNDGADETLFIQSIAVLRDWSPTPLSAFNYLFFNVAGREVDHLISALSARDLFSQDQILVWFKHLATRGSVKVKEQLGDAVLEMPAGAIREKISAILSVDSNATVRSIFE